MSELQQRDNDRKLKVEKYTDERKDDVEKAKALEFDIAKQTNHVEMMQRDICEERTQSDSLGRRKSPAQSVDGDHRQEGPIFPLSRLSPVKSERRFSRSAAVVFHC